MPYCTMQSCHFKKIITVSHFRLVDKNLSVKEYTGFGWIFYVYKQTMSHC